jgi:3-hydroxyacyl-CoA dehydrogenase/enoyl-CoA hydratase/3-hydroxybutyryl-CoA epimerase
LGWGFAPYTGGPLSYIDTMGATNFVALCKRLAKSYGERFKPNALLADLAKKDEGFYPRVPAKAAA